MPKVKTHKATPSDSRIRAQAGARYAARSRSEYADPLTRTTLCPKQMTNGSGACWA